MNYSLFTEDILLKRFDTLPEHVQELLSNEQTEKLVMQIGKSHYLNREKIEILQQLTALVLLGFIDSRDLKQELSEQLYLNFEHATALSNELASEIFNSIKGDLAQIYMPIEEQLELTSSAESRMRPIPTTREDRKPEEKTTSIPIKEGVPAKPQQQDNEAPLVLHETMQFGSKSEERAKVPFKDLSKSFSFFSQKITPQEIQNPIKAKVEVPGQQTQQPTSKPQPEKRVVHYSELRTPISPATRGGEFINLETFAGTSKSNVAPIKPSVSPKQSKNGTISKEVSIEGNTIDLRN